MELSKAIEIVNSYLPKIAFLGKEVNEAASLVVQAAASYEKASWRYFYRYLSENGNTEWEEGFPSHSYAEENGLTIEQLRAKGNDNLQKGVWAPLEDPTAL